MCVYFDLMPNNTGEAHYQSVFGILLRDSISQPEIDINQFLLQSGAHNIRALDLVNIIY
jgi:hypothetical protein